MSTSNQTPLDPTKVKPADWDGGAVTSANLPPLEPAVPLPPPSRNYIPENDPNIIAKPLVLPEFSDVRKYLANPNIEVRWVNFVAQNGLRATQLSYAGMVPVTPQDIKPGALKEYFKDGKFINGDVMLMKVDRATYFGWLKKNRERADALSNKSLSKKTSRRGVRQILAEQGAPQEMLNKISVFSPTEAEIAAFGNNDSE